MVSKNKIRLIKYKQKKHVVWKLKVNLAVKNKSFNSSSMNRVGVYFPK